ncbi:MAG TPA: 2'-5' RNA ligase family protein [Chitinophagaceae bacterium]|nr:2'-5' RNA ligase family protein [Chitinophagaceae bacterium]
MKLDTTHGLPLFWGGKEGEAAIPGYRIYEYLLVLNPHEELRNKIMKVKQEFYDTYKAPVGGKPHVTLVNFLQYEMMEERVITRLKTIAMGYHPIKVEMKDYGSFPSHTIYINITSKVPIQNLVKEIRHESQRLMKLNDDNKPHFILEPHITIARKLQPWQYEKGWLEYSHRHFTGRFIADAMLLLKRPVGEKRYQIAARFDFENLPVNTVQGELFT